MNELWKEIGTATWVANTGIPTLLTVAAIIFAYLFMRRQLRHDRELSLAARRVDAVIAAAGVLDDAVERLDSHGSRTCIDSDWWDRAEWPDHSDCQEALRRLHDEFYRVARKKGRSTSAARLTRQNHELLAARIETISNEWWALTRLQKAQPPADFNREEWRKAVFAVKTIHLSRRARPLSALVSRLHEWDGNDLLVYPLHPTTDHSTVIDSFAAYASEHLSADCESISSAIARYVGWNEQEDRVVGEEVEVRRISLQFVRTPSGTVLVNPGRIARWINAIHVRRTSLIKSERRPVTPPK